IVLINGESVGQVASQTLQSMSCISSVVSMPIIRPLVTYDKLDIIDLSRKIGCYDTSIQPFEDCCTVYVPKKPSTAPINRKAEEFESKFDFGPLITKAVENTKSLYATHQSHFDITMKGFVVSEVL
ncbi:MAG: hypothetical protein KJ847_01060, partial [Firmicutes bacterium]|nr:hypothetical protein [Bacillota bacterium]